MPCLRCGVEFGLFKRETYCRSCGFSFCNSCLSKKCIVPKLGTDTKHTVCHKCFTFLNSGSSEVNANGNKTKYSPPAALQKRMELLENQHGSYNNANGCSLKSSDFHKDKVLADRLERLRSERSSESPPSLHQLEERLAKLKGSSLPSSQQATYIKPDTRTLSDCSQDLLKQVTKEVELESRLPDPDEEIRLRLEKLRNDDVALNDLNKPSASGGECMHPSIIHTVPPTANDDFSNPEILEVWQYMMDAEKDACREAEEALKLQEKDVELKQKLHEIRVNRDSTKCHRETKISNGDLSDEDNEDKVVDKVIQQFLSASRLESSMGSPKVTLHKEKNKEPYHRSERKLINSSDVDDTDLEELPWCVICNNDATLRCYGCDGDLYCRRCFRETHDAFELRDHPSGSFVAKCSQPI